MTVTIAVLLLAFLALGFNAQIIDISGSSIQATSITITGNNVNTTFIAHKSVLNASGSPGTIDITQMQNSIVDNTYASSLTSSWTASGDINFITVGLTGADHVIRSTRNGGGTGTLRVTASSSTASFSNTLFDFTAATTTRGDLRIQGVHLIGGNVNGGGAVRSYLWVGWATGTTFNLPFLNSRASFLENVLFNGIGSTISSPFAIGSSSVGLDITAVGPNVLTGAGITGTGSRIAGGIYNFDHTSITAQGSATNPFFQTGFVSTGNVNTLDAGAPVTFNFRSINPTTRVELVTTAGLPLGTSGTVGANFRGTIINWGPGLLSSSSGNQLAVPGGSCIRVTGDTNQQFFRASSGVNSVFQPASDGPRDLYFIPHLSNFVSNAGALFCDATATLAVRPSPTVIGGISFTPKLSFLLTHTFRNLFGEPQTSAGTPWLVTSGAFDIRSGSSSSSFGAPFTVTQVSSTVVSGSITRAYQIDVTTTCDGSTAVVYYGAYEHTDNNCCSSASDRDHGFIGSSRSLVYAACLANQFCF